MISVMVALGDVVVVPTVILVLLCHHPISANCAKRGESKSEYFQEYFSWPFFPAMPKRSNEHGNK